MRLTIEEQAQIELKHIELELKNNRDQHLRHFMDQYYCYRHGYVRGKNNRADWEAIVWNDKVSLAAREMAAVGRQLLNDSGPEAGFANQFLLWPQIALNILGQHTITRTDPCF